MKIKPSIILLLIFSAVHAAVDTAVTPRLNVVLILVDDLGWRDAGFMGSTQMRTPVVDRLAHEGVMFTAAYSSAPNCAPTRACLLSGQYTPRHGVYTVYDERHIPGLPHHRILSTPTKTELPDNCITLAEAFRAGGYATGMFGMWNLGNSKSGAGAPEGQGFDSYVRPRTLGFDNDRYWNAEKKELSASLTDRAIAWTAEKRDKPFFLYLPYHAVHVPLEPDPADVAAVKTRGESTPAPAEYVATVEALDRQIGRLIEALRAQGQLQKTVIVYTSDNGGTRQYGEPLRGGKGELYEGGIRVPLAIWGAPGALAGYRSAAPTLSMDLYPTLLDLVGVARPANNQLDGESLVPILKGQKDLERKEVFWHFPCYVGHQSPASAMRQGQYKIIEWFENGKLEVFDLSVDPSEANDLSSTQAELRDRLHQRLVAWQRETNAPTPRTPNPAFDPNARYQGGGPDKGKGEGQAKEGGDKPKGGGQGKGGQKKPVPEEKKDEIK